MFSSHSIPQQLVQERKQLPTTSLCCSFSPRAEGGACAGRQEEGISPALSPRNDGRDTGLGGKEANQRAQETERGTGQPVCLLSEHLRLCHTCAAFLGVAWYLLQSICPGQGATGRKIRYNEERAAAVGVWQDLR